MEILRAYYNGPDRADIKNGEIYDIMELKDTGEFYGVKDNSGEWYAYPKFYFNVISDNCSNSSSLR